MRLTEEQEHRAIDIVQSALRRAEVGAPWRGEMEPQYTARCVRGLVAQAVSRMRLSGMTAAGEGGPRVAPVYALGGRFYPDVTVAFRRNLLYAIEVKFLREGSRNNALAVALGQAMLYRLRFVRSTIFLVDVEGRCEHSDVAALREEFSAMAGPEVVVRHRSGEVLLPG